MEATNFSVHADATLDDKPATSSVNQTLETINKKAMEIREKVEDAELKIAMKIDQYVVQRYAAMGGTALVRAIQLFQGEDVSAVSVLLGTMLTLGMHAADASINAGASTQPVFFGMPGTGDHAEKDGTNHVVREAQLFVKLFNALVLRVVWTLLTGSFSRSFFWGFIVFVFMAYYHVYLPFKKYEATYPEVKDLPKLVAQGGLKIVQSILKK